MGIASRRRCLSCKDSEYRGCRTISRQTLLCDRRDIGMVWGHSSAVGGMLNQDSLFVLNPEALIDLIFMEDQDINLVSCP